jgi:ABC-type lipoprotein release transport system permease subunit
MTLLIKLAWRNVLRNKRRALLSGFAVGITLASLMLIDALYLGMMDSMIRTATDTFLGQAQIHSKGFKDTFEVENTIKDSDTIIKSLSTENLLSEFSPRTVSYGMLSSAAGVNSIMLYGIDPDREKNISIIDEAIIQGKYLDRENEMQIMIGYKAAETLEVELGDRVVLTIAQAETGELSQEMFRLSGIFNMGIREADSGMAFINIEKAQKLLSIGNSAHEIAMKFHDINNAGDRSLGFWKKYSQDGNEAEGWKELVPQLESIIDMTKVSTIITSSLVFCIVVVIIMHALFMSLYERMFEFGILRAIGTRPMNMALIIFIEATSLSLISIILGTLLGLIVISLLAYYGIDYKGIEFAGVTITELLYPELALKQFTLYPALIFIFSLTAAIYPAVFAAKMTPAKAMQRSL